MTITALISGDEDFRFDIDLLGWEWDIKKPRGPVGRRGGGKAYGGDWQSVEISALIANGKNKESNAKLNGRSTNGKFGGAVLNFRMATSLFSNPAQSSRVPL